MNNRKIFEISDGIVIINPFGYNEYGEGEYTRENIEEFLIKEIKEFAEIDTQSDFDHAIGQLQQFFYRLSPIYDEYGGL